MKIVHGFRCILLPVGVLAPVLSVSGDARPSSTFMSDPARWISGVAFPDCGAGGFEAGSSPTTGDVWPLAPPFAAASRSACFFSFFRSFFARSFSALSAGENEPLGFASLGVSGADWGSGGVDGLDLPPVRCGGRGLSLSTGVPEPRVDKAGVSPFRLCAGRPETIELGVADSVAGLAVRR